MFDPSNSDSERSPRPTLPPHIITVMPPSPSIDEEKHEDVSHDVKQDSPDHISVIEEEQITDHNHLPLGTEYLTFRERAFYGVNDNNSSSNYTKTGRQSDNMLDIYMVPCSCFSFLNIFNKQKSQ